MTGRPEGGAPSSRPDRSREEELPERWTVAEEASVSPEPDRGRADRRELVDRSRARAWALQIHYLWESEAGEATLRDTLVQALAHRRIAKRRIPRIRTLLMALDEHLEKVDAVLEEALDNWRLERLSAIDRGILRLGAVEILHLPDIPPKASILEAVRLAEAYGGNESPRFVNGVLDAIYKREEPDGRG